jgi:succinate dehydrogenase cytochrome b subunit
LPGYCGEPTTSTALGDRQFEQHFKENKGSDVETMARFLASSVGRKILMAVTGLLLIGFLIIHLAGNLLIFSSAQAFNEYSHKLISNPLIYVAELILFLLFCAHFVSGILVYRAGSEARPESYRNKRWAGGRSHKSWASTTMIWTGLIVLVFVPLHIWTFKFGPYYAVAGEEKLRDLHRLVIEVFQKPLYVAWYVVALTLIGFHLWHGFGSAFESLGVHYRKSLRRFGQLLAVVLAVGFLSIPVLVYLMGDKL